MASDDGFDDESLLASVIAAERDAGAAWTSGEPKAPGGSAGDTAHAVVSVPARTVPAIELTFERSTSFVLGFTFGTALPP